MVSGADMSTSAHQKAARKWFFDAERRRKRAKLAPGRLAKDTPPAPCSPAELHRLIYNGVNYVGEARAREVLQVNRTTLARWLSGASQVPRSAVIVLQFLAEGIPPGLGNHWRGFQWAGNSLYTPAGREVSVSEIEGIQYLHAHVDALERRVRELQAALFRVQRLTGAANDSAAMLV